VSKSKKTKADISRRFFDFGDSKNKGGPISSNYFVVLKVFAVSVVLAVIAASFYYLEQYVNASPKVLHAAAKLKFDKPVWAGDDLLEKIKSAASRDENFAIDDNLAASVARNLTSIAWLQNVQVRISGDTVAISANWRKPVALYQGAKQQVYIAADLTVLDYVPLPALPIVELIGVSGGQQPEVGRAWTRADVVAAIDILNALDNMDQIAQKPLLYQLASIDVANFNARKSASEPHIVLKAKDGTNIKWGAAIGASQRYVEATDQEKLAMLYDFYKLHGTLQNIVKYIELRYPQKSIPQPSMQ
jgi:hypothetical protein